MLRGWASPALLDTYEAERRPVAEHTVARSADPQRLAPHAPSRRSTPTSAAGSPTSWAGERSTLDLLGPGLTLFAGRDGAAWEAAAATLRDPRAGRGPASWTRSPPARSAPPGAPRCSCGPTAKPAGGAAGRRRAGGGAAGRSRRGRGLTSRRPAATARGKGCASACRLCTRHAWSSVVSKDPCDRVVAAFVGVALAASACGSEPERSPPTSSEPAFRTSRATLDAALHCGPGVTDARAAPVLLLTGGGTDGSVVWPPVQPTLAAAGHPSCYVDFPQHTTGDLQTAAEYVTHGDPDAGRPVGPPHRRVRRLAGCRPATDWR